jgi:glycyl-tRNA synthetase
MTYLDNETNEKYHPYVVEPSLGVERLFLAVIKDSLTEETLPDGTTRELLKIHPFLAPYQVAVFPLIRKRHQAKAEAVYELLSKELSVLYDETQTIGKRYRRQDQIGTPFAVTIDDETLANETVTVRERDTMEQITLKIDEVASYIKLKTKF